MNGAGHYLEAEELLDGTDAWDMTNPGERQIALAAIAEAQVHATLALAAATALANEPDGGQPPHDFAEWFDVAGTPCPESAPPAVTA